MMKRLLMGAAGLAALGGCMANDGVEPMDDMPRMATATADIRDSAGRSVGTATASQSGDSIRLSIEGTGLPQGAHGAHVHMTGSCVAPAFTSAGDHWNPTGREHGKDNPAGMHMGDLPNIVVGTNGVGTLEYTIPGAWVAGGPMPLLDADGAAIVIHAGADDYRSNPSGNSGARIACGVFR
jgi:superoxide dismutase, Cu-Zn family